MSVQYAVRPIYPGHWEHVPHVDMVSHLEDIGVRSVTIDMDIRSSPAFIVAASTPLPFLHIHEQKPHGVYISCSKSSR